MNPPPDSDPAHDPEFYDEEMLEEDYAAEPLGGQPPAGYTRVQAPKKTKVGDKYKGTGKPPRKRDPRAPNPWANLGIWAVGLGLPVMLVYFFVQKLFVDKIDVQYDPYPAVQVEKEQEKPLLALGKQIATELQEGSKAELQRRVVWPEVIYRVCQNMELGLHESTVIRDGIRAHWTADIPGLFRQILGSDLERVDCQFVKLRTRAGYPALLLRTMVKPGRVSYFDLLVVPVEGQWQVADIWDCQRGMFASDWVRREVIMELPTANEANRPWKAVFGEDLTKEQILAIKNMIPSEVLNKPHVLQDLRELPDSVRNSPFAYDVAIHAYQKLIDGIISPTELENFKQQLTIQPTWSAALGTNQIVTGNLLAEVEAKLEHPEAIEPALLKADAEIGGDPYLKVMVGKHRLASGDLPGAEAMAAEAAQVNRQLPELQSLRNAIEAKRATR